MDNKNSAISDEPVDVLFVLHNKFDLLDMAGPLEALNHALHDISDPTTKAFEVTIAGPDTTVLSEQGVIVSSQISYKEAHAQLKDYDVMVIVGGNSAEILSKPKEEPFSLIEAFAALQKEDSGRERTLLSICTGSLFLAKAGILAGLAATTHHDHITKLEIVCMEAARDNLAERTDVVEDSRYVVNNLRFDLGDEDENPYVRRQSDGRRPSNARKGSISFKDSKRRESIVRRAAMRLGGLRVITSGGISAGVDASLYLISALVSEESAVEVARTMEWNWVKGTVVDGLDV